MSFAGRPGSERLGAPDSGLARGWLGGWLGREPTLLFHVVRYRRFAVANGDPERILVLFDIQTDELDTPGVAVVRVVGELDVATAPRLRQEAVRLVGININRVVLDLSGIDFIDSTGLGVIVGMVKRLRTHGGDLSVVRGHDRVNKVFDITRVSEILPLNDSLAVALAALPPIDPSSGGE